jgi:hypothetical protein
MTLDNDRDYRRVLVVLLTLAVGVVVGTACAAGPDTAPPPVMEVRWYAITPPRSGLRCWFTNVGQGASYCEPDPTATHGASP